MKNVDSEKLVERVLVEEVKKLGGMCIKLLSYHIIGLPDRMCLFPKACIVFVELKTTGQKPKKIQTYIHDKIRALGFRVEVLDSVKEVKELCKDYAN